MRVPVAGPSITALEIAYVSDAVATAWYEGANEYHARFEAAFADYLGVRHAITLPSCTSALHLALLALDIGPGDEVVVPDVTWIASVAPVAYVGATPVFADIDPQTWGLSPASFAACVTPRTKAVIPVDLYGHPADYDAIRQVAASRGITVIEDAAEAIGSRWRGRLAGALGEIGAFSFHGSKTLTTGEGGMLVTDRDDVRERVLALRDHGRAPGPKQFWNAEIGYKYKMSAMQAALGLAQLERIEELIARKRAIFGWYRDGLAGIPGLTLNAELPDAFSTYWMVTAVLDPSLGLPKEAFMARLAAKGVDSRPFFYPLSSQPAFDGHPQAIAAAERNRAAYAVAPWGVNLPSALALDEQTVARVCAAVEACLKEGPA